MSPLKDKNSEQKSLGFKWGIEKGIGGKNKDLMFYESFSHEGEEYFVNDCVYFDLGEPEASVGKLVTMFEGPNYVKRIKVVWFMRPSEIKNYLGDYEPRWNEIFLASGQGRGLSNFNLVESITGKCFVVCTSNDHRNPQASEADFKCADYFFRCHFDVGDRIISDTFPDVVDGVRVEQFFNKKKEQKPLGPPDLKSNVKEQSRKPNFSFELKRKKFIGNTIAAEVEPNKKRKLFQDERISGKLDDQDYQLGQNRGINIDNQLVTVSRRPDADRSNWFKQLPWKQRLERAQEAGTLISLLNLDPSYTSTEIEDLVWHAFKVKVEAKMIEQSSFSCPHSGKALIIFKSKEAANSAIHQLVERCLMLADGRPLLARREPLRKPSKMTAFVGHLTLDKLPLQRQTEEMKKAKSTSHASQPNTIEYDMGMEWMLLQDKSDMWWKALHERQAKEKENARKQLKMKCSN